VVAGNLVLRWEARVGLNGSTTTGARPCATNLLIDRAIRDEADPSKPDLGASPNDRLGSVRFKQSFGARRSVTSTPTRWGGWKKPAGALRRQSLRRPPAAHHARASQGTPVSAVVLPIASGSTIRWTSST
jgi:hypothetical protein